MALHQTQLDLSPVGSSSPELLEGRDSEPWCLPPTPDLKRRKTAGTAKNLLSAFRDTLSNEDHEDQGEDLANEVPRWMKRTEMKSRNSSSSLGSSTRSSSFSTPEQSRRSSRPTTYSPDDLYSDGPSTSGDIANSSEGTNGMYIHQYESSFK